MDLQESIQANIATLTSTQMQRIQEETLLQQIGGRVKSTLQSSQNQFLESYRSLLGEALNKIYTEGDFDLIPRSDIIATSGFTYDVTFEVTAKLKVQRNNRTTYYD